MIIFGVDPGTICTGYGIINSNGNEIADISSGVIKPSASMNLGEKLAFIYDELSLPPYITTSLSANTPRGELKNLLCATVPLPRNRFSI